MVFVNNWLFWGGGRAWGGHARDEVGRILTTFAQEEQMVDGAIVLCDLDLCECNMLQCKSTQSCVRIALGGR